MTRLNTALVSFASVLLPALSLAVLPDPEIVSKPALATMYNADGSVNGDWSGGGTGMSTLFDGDFSSGCYIGPNGKAANGCYLVLDFSSVAPNGYYVTEIKTGSESAHQYSLYYSKDGENWIASEDGVGVSKIGNMSFTVGDTIYYVKVVFDQIGGWTKSFSELEVWGYEPPQPQKISSVSLAKMYNPDGTLAGDGTGGFGGGSVLSWFFNGYKEFSENAGWARGGTFLPNLANGGWCELDFSSVMPGGYYVTSMAITQCNLFPYSLYWSSDGETWNAVDDAVEVCKVGEASYAVNKVATHVRIVFNQTGGWTLNISEIEVWGLDPADVACTHPSFTAWEYVEDSASCLLPGKEHRFCTVCGTEFFREQDVPLGHDFVSHLQREGKFKQFGTGYIGCSRCDWRLDFPSGEESPYQTAPLDLITNTVDGTKIGRISIPGQVNFTDVTVTSTGNSSEEPNPGNNWGVSPTALLDNNWTWGWQCYWYARLWDDQHIDYVFGTEIDLAWIDIAVNNNAHTNFFYSVDDETGIETPLTKFQVIRTDGKGMATNIEHDPLYHLSSAPVNNLAVAKDWAIRYICDENGVPLEDEDGNRTEVEGYGESKECQRFTLRFYNTPVKHLRVRQEFKGTRMCISELHPWGTVHGASDQPNYVGTVLILR